MKSFAVKILFFTLMVLIIGPIVSSGVFAQKRDILGSFRDWDALIITEGSTKTCYMISSPKKSTANKRNVRRGDIYITITHRPSVGVKSEVNAVMGYPLRPSSEVKFAIDGKRPLSFFTQGSAAWAYDSKDDTNAVAAMKRGSNLVVTGTSARGTATTDTYSLSGFTAAHNAITRACG